MAKITFITSDGTSINVNGTNGSVMELAKEHDIAGIDGNCGGVCSCATCHVYVAPDVADKIGAASEIENDMLELDDNVKESSRLCCQIEVAEVPDGAVFHVAN